MTPYTYNIAHSQKYASVYNEKPIRIIFFNLFLNIVILSEIRSDTMKFYHLIGFSTMLLIVEFTLLSVLKIDLSTMTRWIFVLLQGLTLVFYTSAISIYTIGRSRKKWVRKQQAN